MGWFGQQVKKENIKEFIFDSWNNQEVDHGKSILVVKKHEVFGSTHVLAVARQDKNTGDIQEVFAVVSLTTYNNGELMVKDITEDMLPQSFPVTRKFLGLLSDTDNDSALAWREGCDNLRRRQAWLSKNLVNGCTVDLGDSTGLLYDGKELSGKVKYFKYGRKEMVVFDGINLHMPRGWKKQIVDIVAA